MAGRGAGRATSAAAGIEDRRAAWGPPGVKLRPVLVGAGHGLAIDGAEPAPTNCVKQAHLSGWGAGAYIGSLIVAFPVPLPQRSCRFGFEPPLLPPSHSLQPSVHPTENHRQVCADSHGSVPFTQAHG